MALKKSTPKSEYWAAQVAKWRESGLPATRFCKKQKIHIASFYNWRKRLAGQQTSPVAETPNFMPVKVLPSLVSTDETDVVLTFGTGPSMRLKGRLSPEHLAEVVRAMGAAC